MKPWQTLIFELDVPGRRGYCLPELDIEESPLEDLVDAKYLATTLPKLPSVYEVDVVRHYTELSTLNYGVDTGFYPLGSCTMKYNPKVNEWAARLPGFAELHPHQPYSTTQGIMELLADLEAKLCAISGMDRFTMQPAAGAHGELTGIMMVRKYHEVHGEGHRNKIIVPDSAHGTNPATAAMAGYEIVEVKSTEQGLVDVAALKEVADENLAGLMLTNPNTLGLFEKDIQAIAAIVHEAGGLLYYDGANANAILGHARPGDMGFDIVHFNVHKTFSTPHGGGGPGAGPVGVVKALADYLPAPLLDQKERNGKPYYYWNYDVPHTIGRVKDFYGHIGVLVRAYTYLLSMGSDGLKDVAEKAVLNANYIQERLKGAYNVPHDTLCKHECVIGGLKEPNGTHTLDVAKRLLDYGFHPPTVYFPLIVPEAMMIEPTETESKERLDEFVDAMLTIAQEAKEDPEILLEAPHHKPVRRPDETLAARKPKLVYGGEEENL